ncbi:hypothetical protein [Hafnia alvei]|uniref:hypothetical protein n=1 Tax=Hafnia alvei TaxID=569 RepID=UPI0010342B4E|nr:hypothetical protein [Hafnia alvei]TBL62069.1 hypothetical protein EYY92_05430 [Hafnia alvei]
MSELTTERLEKRIKNCIEVGNGCVMLPVSMAEELLAYRKTVNHLLDNDGSRGKFSAVQSYDAREDLEQLLASTVQQNEPQNIPENIPAQPVIPEHSGDNLPCPFCGGEVDVSGWRSSNGNSGPECNECGATASNLSDWNKRTAQHVSEPYKLPSGWMLVPIEPTENMIIDGFESEPDKTFSKPEVWEEYAAMSGCKQAAHRAKLCWAAMLAAAPTQQKGE